MRSPFSLPPKLLPSFLPVLSVLLYLALCEPAAAQRMEPSPAVSPVFSPASTSLVTVHYHRADKNYDRPGLWTWDARDQRMPQEQELFPAGTDDFGVFFYIDPALYGEDDSAADRIGFLPRLRQDWNAKDGTDRFWTPALGQEIWLVSNDPKIYTSRPDISPRIVAAYLDAPNRITAILSHSFEGQPNVEKLQLLDAQGQPVDPKITGWSIASGQQALSLVTMEPLDWVGKHYRVAVDEYRPAALQPRHILDDATLFHSTAPQGAVYSPEATTFRLFSPMALRAEVVLYDTATGASGRRVVPMERAEKGLWEAKVEGNLEGKFYRLHVETPGRDGHEANDVWATNTTGLDGNARITNLRALDPEGFRPVKHPFQGAPTDAVIYELHVRDASVAPNSGAAPEHRGKYLALARPGARHPENADVKTLLDHIAGLGVTHIQLLPPQDHDNNESNPVYNWGYMTSFFNSPEGSYATNHRDESRVREFKALVHAAHQAGVAIVMDVVYNHTAPTATFEELAPGYFHRRRDDGTFWNGSGTGNEFRSEAPMGRQFIVDSCKFWVEEYGVDGFRFDLMGLVDLETMKQVKAELEEIYPHILVYGEPWAATAPDDTGLKNLTYKDKVRGTGIGAFNDHFRNALKGSPDGHDGGYVQHGTGRDGVMRGIEGSINDWAAHPLEAINYATCHDNLVLWDKLKVSTNNAPEEELRKMQMLTHSILSVSQGVLFLNGGEEFLRTKGGDHNSYSSGDRVNRLDWDLAAKHRDVVDLHRGMIALRRAHPLFRLETADEVRNRLRFHNDNLPDGRAIVFSVDGRGLQGEEWDAALVLINPAAEPLLFRLPLEGEWAIFTEGPYAGIQPLGSVENNALVPGRSVMVLGR